MPMVTVTADARLSICFSLCRDGEIYKVFDFDGVLMSLIADDDPVREIARTFLRNGAPAETYLEVWHCHGDGIWITTTLGDAAAETFEDGGNVVQMRRAS